MPRMRLISQLRRVFESRSTMGSPVRLPETRIQFDFKTGSEAKMGDEVIRVTGALKLDGVRDCICPNCKQPRPSVFCGTQYSDAQQTVAVAEGAIVRCSGCHRRGGSYAMTQEVAQEEAERRFMKNPIFAGNKAK